MPAYILEEARLLRNLSILRRVREESGIMLLFAIKSSCIWKTFELFRGSIDGIATSGLWEAHLAYDKFGGLISTFSPAFEKETFDEVCHYSSHIVFNSYTQYLRFRDAARGRVSVGLRINPHYSEVRTTLYNTVVPGTRFGVSETDLPATLPSDIEGLHFHALCENGAGTLCRVLQSVEKHYGPWLEQVRWFNMGGGHLITCKDYDVELLIRCLREFKGRHPHLIIIMEPGEAFLWDCGSLVARVEDIVKESGIQTAVLNVSVACHMPDCLEMPYQPEITGAVQIAADSEEAKGPCAFRIGGNSCLSGDYLGMWKFPRPLQVGDLVAIEDMMHYTTVKTTMFNGIAHPDIAIKHLDGRVETLRHFEYSDYENRMD